MDQALRTLIVDDEPQAIAILEKHLANMPEIELVGKTVRPSEVLSMTDTCAPDLLFLDIDMPEMNGFEVLDELYREGLRPDVIFVTAFNEHAIRAIRYSAFDYILKPVDPEELKHAVARHRRSRGHPESPVRVRVLSDRMSEHKMLKICTTGGFILINPDEVVYIRADWNYAEIHLSKDRSETVTLNIGMLEEQLPTGRFFRISRSVIINTRFLDRVSRKKRLVVLKKEGSEFCFPIPVLNIRRLEKFLEGG